VSEGSSPHATSSAKPGDLMDSMRAERRKFQRAVPTRRAVCCHRGTSSNRSSPGLPLPRSPAYLLLGPLPGQ
jgi:hypothetical protein